MKANKFITGMNKRRPEIMLGGGIGGAIISAFVIGYYTPEFKQRIQEEKTKNENQKIPVGTFLKTAFDVYGLSALGFVTSGASVAMGLHDMHKRESAAISAAVINKATIDRMTDKMTESIGTEKTDTIIKEVAAEGVPVDTPVRNSKKYEFEDAYTGVRFTTTLKVVDKAFSRLEKDIILHDAASIRELYWTIMELDPICHIEIPKTAERFEWTPMHLRDGEIDRSYQPRFYENEDVIRMIIDYDEPRTSDCDY